MLTQLAAQTVGDAPDTTMDQLLADILAVTGVVLVGALILCLFRLIMGHKQQRVQAPSLSARECDPDHLEGEDPADNDPDATPEKSGENPPAVTMADARERFACVEDEYTTSEIDPTVLIEAPALRDVTVATTIAFHQSYDQARKLLDEYRRNQDHAPASQEVIDTVATLEAQWREAVDTAYRIGLSGLSQINIRRARAAFNTAFDPAATPAEARAARDRLINYLDQVVTTLDAEDASHLDGQKVVEAHIAHVELAPSVRLALEA
jgi:hypothetical protein